MTLADAPQDWPEPSPMSTLHALLFFGALPLALFVGIALLVMVPSIARGPRYRPGLSWWADPEWFGGPGRELPAAGRPAQPALEAAADNPGVARPARVGGGASARW